jgi:glycosyltransferase involved in cell wall biosynthesis
VEVAIAVNSSNHSAFMASYPELQGRVKVESYAPGKLEPVLVRYGVVVATINNSVREIRDALTKVKNPPDVAYYVQDYEPLFYPPDSPDWHAARASYTLMPGMRLFAKTRWLQKIVNENHGVQVYKVEPSIDHDAFYPDLSRPTDTMSVVAMVRPKTPRRAPARTIRVMQALRDQYGEAISLQIFGATDREILSAGFELPEGVVNHGPLRRTEVPALLRNSDLFLDLSDYQAFGRTALEAMASGCVPVVPVMGGADEFAVDGVNSFVVDTRSVLDIITTVKNYCVISDNERLKMRINCIRAASLYTIRRASLSEFDVLARYCDMSR